MTGINRSEANEIKRMLAAQHAESVETKRLMVTLLNSVGDQRDSNGDHVTLAVLGERLDVIVRNQADGCPALVEPTARIQSLEQWKEDSAKPAIRELKGFRMKMLTFGLGGGGLIAAAIELFGKWYHENS